VRGVLKASGTVSGPAGAIRAAPARRRGHVLGARRVRPNRTRRLIRRGGDFSYVSCYHAATTPSEITESSKTPRISMNAPHYWRITGKGAGEVWPAAGWHKRAAEWAGITNAAEGVWHWKHVAACCGPSRIPATPCNERPARQRAT
jgi:hypothetical protein